MTTQTRPPMNPAAQWKRISSWPAAFGWIVVFQNMQTLKSEYVHIDGVPSMIPTGYYGRLTDAELAAIKRAS